MSLSTEDIDIENSTASVLFDKGWKLQQELYKTSDETSQSYETKRLRTIEILVKCETILDELHLYSDNESLDEISTNELRYFLNYALLGWLYSKVNSTNPKKRLEALENAKYYIIKYLSLTKMYGFHSLNVEVLKKETNSASTALEHLSSSSNTTSTRQAAFDQNLMNQAFDRNEKIKRFKEQREIESQLDTFNLCLNKPLCDEEQKREIFTTYIKYWLNKSIDDFKSISDEINILKSMTDESMNHRQGFAKPSTASANVAPMKPYIITKDALQAKVFGAGYPSLPVYSIEEFYDQLADKGMMPKGGEEHKHPVVIGKGVTETQKQDEKAEKDLREERDDDEELRKQREWDEFKDENKRGAGNRYNRS